MALLCVRMCLRVIKSILASVKVAARVALRKEGPENLKKSSFTTLCASSVSHDKYFPGEWTTLCTRASLRPSLRLSIGTTKTSEEEEKGRIRPGPEVRDDRPYVRPRASVRQLIHYRPSSPLSSLSLPHPALTSSLISSLVEIAGDIRTSLVQTKYI